MPGPGGERSWRPSRRTVSPGWSNSSPSSSCRCYACSPTDSGSRPGRDGADHRGRAVGLRRGLHAVAVRRHRVRRRRARASAPSGPWPTSSAPTTGTPIIPGTASNGVSSPWTTPGTRIMAAAAADGVTLDPWDLLAAHGQQRRTAHQPRGARRRPRGSGPGPAQRAHHQQHRRVPGRLAVTGAGRRAVRDRRGLLRGGGAQTRRPHLRPGPRATGRRRPGPAACSSTTSRAT